MECLHRHNFCHLRPFLAFFTSLLTSKIQIWKKNVKKSLEILSFYTCVPLIKIIWRMVPEVWSSADIIFLSSWAVFCRFTPLTTWKMKISKMILHKSTKNHDIMLYCSWDMVCEGCNCYFSFWAIFLPFNPPNSPKNENLKIMKKTPEDIILHKCTKNHDHMLYCSWDMVRDRYHYFTFWAIFCPFISPPLPPSNRLKNQNFKKSEKKLGDIIILRMCTKDDDKMMYYSWDMVCNRRRDGQMDRKSDI